MILVGAFVKLTRGQPLDNISIAFEIDNQRPSSGSIALMQYVSLLGIQIFHYLVNWLSAFIGKGKGHHGKLGSYIKSSPKYLVLG